MLNAAGVRTCSGKAERQRRKYSKARQEKLLLSRLSFISCTHLHFEIYCFGNISNFSKGMMVALK